MYEMEEAGEHVSDATLALRALMIMSARGVESWGWTMNQDRQRLLVLRWREDFHERDTKEKLHIIKSIDMLEHLRIITNNLDYYVDVSEAIGWESKKPIDEKEIKKLVRSITG